MTTSARLSLSPGATIAPALERAARARGSNHLRFRTSSGVLDRAVLGFEDLPACAYRTIELPRAVVVCLDGAIDISPTGARATIAAVVEDERGRHLSGRLLEGQAGGSLELVVDEPLGRWLRSR